MESVNRSGAVDDCVHFEGVFGGGEREASSGVHANEEVFGWLWRFPVAKFGAGRFVGFHWQKMDRQDSRREADRSVGGAA